MKASQSEIKAAKEKASKLLSLKVEYKLLAICEITGIAITIDTPAIEGISLDYVNPLSFSSNFLKLAELPFTVLTKLEKPILSGLVLASMKHFELIDCPMTSAAQNLSLQSLHENFLVESFKFFSISINKTNHKSLPKVTFKPKDVNEIQISSIHNVIKTYIEDCKGILTPVPSPMKELEVQTAFAHRMKKGIEKARKDKANLQADLIKAGRRAIKELSGEAILSANLINALKITFTSENILSLADSRKEKMLVALNKHSDNSTVLSLIKILNNKTFATSLDSLFIEEEEKEIELREVETRIEEEIKPVLSFKERLAQLKKEKNERKMEEIIKFAAEVSDIPYESNRERAAFNAYPNKGGK